MKKLLIALAIGAFLAGCGGGSSGGSTAPPATIPTATPTPAPSSNVGVTITIVRPSPTPTPFLDPGYPNNLPLILSRTTPSTIGVFSTQTGLAVTTSNAACATAAASAAPSGFTYGVTITAAANAAPTCLAIITIAVGTQSDQAYVLVP